MCFLRNSLNGHNRLSAEVRYGTVHERLRRKSCLQVIIAFRLKSAMGLQKLIDAFALYMLVIIAFRLKSAMGLQTEACVFTQVIES